VTVDYATADGTATAAASDYAPRSGTVTFAPGQTQAQVRVPIVADALDETDESFFINLSNPTGRDVIIGDGQAELTIRDDDTDAAPTQVVQVFVAGTRWSQAFRDRLQARGLGSGQYGFAVPGGAAQLQSLPWANVNQVSVRFSEGAVVDPSALSIGGVNVAAYSPAAGGFHYDAPARVATWTLAQNLGPDRVLLRLGSGGATDASGNPLDGEWDNAGDSYPSGDGRNGGDFLFRLNVLPGDVTGNGRVDALDWLHVRSRLLRTARNPGAGAFQYTANDDLNGDGFISAADLLVLRRGLAGSLPSGQAATLAPAPAVASARSPFLT
jgi:hypothetical protein